MSVKINIIEKPKKKQLRYQDLLEGAFFFYKNNPHDEEHLLVKIGNGGHSHIQNGHYTAPNNILADAKVVLADVTIDVQVKE